MKKKNMIGIFLVVILIIIILTIIFSNDSYCEYKVTYEYEEEYNISQCSIAITACSSTLKGAFTGGRCILPGKSIQCGESMNACGTPIKCTCSKEDNTDRIKVK